MEGRPKGAEPTLRESKSALLEAAQAAIEVRKPLDGRRGRGPRSARSGFRLTLLLVVVVAAAALIARPEWFVGRAPIPETVPIQTASARLALVDAIGRVQAYITTAGHLPTAPHLAGVTNRDIRLTPLPDGEFEVSLQAGDSLIAVRSTDSLKPLVAEAVRALQRRS